MSLGTLFAVKEIKAPTKKGKKAAAVPEVAHFDLASGQYLTALEQRAQELHADPNFDMKSVNLRYSTAVKLGRLEHKSIVVLGVGGIGTWVVRLLAGMGATNITIIDYDIVEAHNVGPQSFDLADLGKLKVDAMSDAILRHRFIKIAKHNVKIESYDHLIEILGGTPDVLISCVDSMELRNSLAKSLMVEKARDLIQGRIRSEDRPALVNQFPELFVNTAMSLGVWNVFAMPIRALVSGRSNDLADESFSEYFRVAVFEPSEAVEEPCTERAIVYTGAGVAAYVAALLHHVNDAPPVNLEALEAFMNLSKPGPPFKWLRSFDSRKYLDGTLSPFQMGKDKKAAAAKVRAMQSDNNSKALLQLLKDTLGGTELPPMGEYYNSVYEIMEEFFMDHDTWAGQYENNPKSGSESLLVSGKMALVNNEMLRRLNGFWQEAPAYFQHVLANNQIYDWADKGFTWAFILTADYNSNLIPRGITEFGSSIEAFWVADDCSLANLRLIPASMVTMVRDSTEAEKAAMAKSVKFDNPAMSIMPWDLKLGDTLCNSTAKSTAMLKSSNKNRWYFQDQANNWGVSQLELAKWITVREKEELAQIRKVLSDRGENSYTLRQVRNPVVHKLHLDYNFGDRSNTPMFIVELCIGSTSGGNRYIRLPLMDLDLHRPRRTAVEEATVAEASLPIEWNGDSIVSVPWFTSRLVVGTRVKLVGSRSFARITGFSEQHVAGTLVQPSDVLIQINNGTSVGLAGIRGIVSQPVVAPVAVAEEVAEVVEVIEVPEPIVVEAATTHEMEVSGIPTEAVLTSSTSGGHQLLYGGVLFREDDVVRLSSGDLVVLDDVYYQAAQERRRTWEDVDSELVVPTGSIVLGCRRFYREEGEQHFEIYDGHTVPLASLMGLETSAHREFPDLHAVHDSGDWVYQYRGNGPEIMWASQEGFCITPASSVMVATVEGGRHIEVASIFSADGVVRPSGDYVSEVEPRGVVRSFMAHMDNIMVRATNGQAYPLSCVCMSLEENVVPPYVGNQLWNQVRTLYVTWLNSDEEEWDDDDEDRPQDRPTEPRPQTEETPF